LRNRPILHSCTVKRPCDQIRGILFRPIGRERLLGSEQEFCEKFEEPGIKFVPVPLLILHHSQKTWKYGVPELYVVCVSGGNVDCSIFD